MQRSRSRSSSRPRSRKISSRQFALMMAAAHQNPDSATSRTRSRSRRRKQAPRSSSKSKSRRRIRNRKIRGGEGEDQEAQVEGQSTGGDPKAKERKTIYSSVNVKEEDGLRESVAKLMNANTRAATRDQNEKRKDTLQQMFDTKNWLGLLTAVQAKTRQDAMEQIQKANDEVDDLRSQLLDTKNIDEKQMNVVFNLGLRWIHNREEWMTFENGDEKAFFDTYGTEFLGYGRVVVDALAQLALLKHALTDGQDANDSKVQGINARWNRIAEMKEPDPEVLEKEFTDLARELNDYASDSKINFDDKKNVLKRPGVDNFMKEGSVLPESNDYSPWIDLLLLKNARGDLSQDITDLTWVVDSYNLDGYNAPNEGGAASSRAYRNELSPREVQDDLEKKMRLELIETLKNYNVKSPVATGKNISETEWPQINFWDDQRARVEATLEIMKKHKEMIDNMISGIPKLMALVEEGWPESGVPFEQHAFTKRYPTGRLHWLDTDGGKDGEPEFANTAQSVREALQSVTVPRSKGPSFFDAGSASLMGGVYGRRPMTNASDQNRSGEEGTKPAPKPEPVALEKEQSRAKGQPVSAAAAEPTGNGQQSDASQNRSVRPMKYGLKPQQKPKSTLAARASR